MQTTHFSRSIVVLLLALFCPLVTVGDVYTLEVDGEQLEFISQPQRGYVLKLPQKAGGISVLSSLSLTDADDARPIRGRDRRGVWVVENNGPALKNEQTTLTLKQRAQAAYTAPLFSSNGEIVAVIPEIVVRVRPSLETDVVQRLCEAARCTIRKRMEFTTQEYLLDALGSDADTVFAAVEVLNQYPEVEWACPNVAFRPSLCGRVERRYPISSGRVKTAVAGEEVNTPGVFANDEYFSEQWHLHNTGQICLYGTGGTPNADINAPEAWEITTGDPNIIVAVLDSGVDTTHPDLINNLVSGYDFLEDDDLPDPALDHWCNAHGTACAGLIAAQGNNGIGVGGVAWNCKIMPIRIFYAEGDSAEEHHFITDSDKATAFRWAASHGSDILSNSWQSWSPKPIVRSAIVDITNPGGIGRDGKGCIVLFASGNEALEGNPKMYPAVYPEVISVGGTNHHDVRWHYSNYGPELDIAAPSGGLELTDIPGGFQCTTDISGPDGVNNRGMPDVYGPIVDLDMDYRYFGGTSAACPVAAGVTALILSVEPNLTNEEVRHFLARSAKDLGDPGWDEYYGWGRVDARAALDMVLAKRADLSNDWKVGLEDLVILIESWESDDPTADIAPATRRDGFVDERDLALMMQYWDVAIPEMGLIAHWKLDETEGAVAFDSAGRHHDATIMGAPLWQPEGGMIGGALQFSGMPNFATAEAVRDPSEGPLSVFAWIQGGAPGQVVISQQTGANWLMADPATGALMTELKSAGRQSKALSSDVVITDGAWHRIGFTWDGSIRRLYVDDILVAEDTDTGPAPSSGSLLLGCGATMIPTTFWQGLIDDLRIYGRAVEP